ncbi:hypothetical protein UNDKW_5054 [Undibacterium sp. KW1]|uniref:hypothetical protein n=1 Tax=Undibacterium sp. KW1 TaxID=2058624 RepID=UPI001331E386|nr:hypothetical protein [Undibacterium sp. KW1]BBB63327.1 hypothetical protein UNDKW_5054 [Undibacterium sp. KW1]
MSLLLGMIWPVCVQARQVNDLTQMDSPGANKTATEQKKAQSGPGSAPKLRAEDSKKYQAAVAGMKGKNGDEILKAMQTANAEKLAKMSPERRKQIEDYQKKYQSELKAGDASPQYKSLDAAMEKLQIHLLGLDRGDGKRMTVQQKTYFEHREAQIRQKYFDPARREKNRRMQDESSAYLKANLDRQADYAKNFESAGLKTEQTKAAPLPMDVLKSNWLVRKMATEEPAALMPRASALPPANAGLIKAQMDDLSLQLRSNKSMTVSQRYGPDARTVSEADGKSKLQELARNGNAVAPAAAMPLPGPGAADKNKAQPEMPARKASPIPGL